MQREADGADDHARPPPARASRGGRPTCPPAARRRACPSASGASLIAGRDRVVALRALVVEDEDEHQREARQAVDERRAGRRRRTGGCGRSSRSSIGARRARLDRARTPAAGRRPTARPPITSGSFQPVDPAARDRRARGRSGRRRTSTVPGRSRPRTASGLASSRRTSAPHARRQPERHVEPEHPRPVDRDERAAEHRPEHEADRRDHRVRPHRDAELLARERVGDERGGVGEQERRRRCPAGCARG